MTDNKQVEQIVRAAQPLFDWIKQYYPKIDIYPPHSHPKTKNYETYKSKYHDKHVSTLRPSV
jgi:hypothetical protein